MDKKGSGTYSASEKASVMRGSDGVKKYPQETMI
jgi:hypothetical protein